MTRQLLWVKDTMDRDFARRWRVWELASLVSLSPTHFRRVFAATFGVTPYRYLQGRRIERAKSLLQGRDFSVTEVARMVGYESLGTFVRTFGEVVGESPTSHRDRTTRPPVPTCFARSANMVVSEKRSASAAGYGGGHVH